MSAPRNVGSVARRGRPRPALVFGGLTLGLLAVGLASLATGAVQLPFGQVARILWDGRQPRPLDPSRLRDIAIVFDIRLPRTLLGFLVGAALATAGALLQGLLRNPLADPALIGVSSGAALAAALTIVLGHGLVAAPPGAASPLLPAAAFVGATVVTALLYGLSTRDGRTSVAVMLLAGIAVAALASAGTGYLAFISDDRQLRDLTFWTLGSLSGATWTKLAAVAPAIVAVLCLAPMLGRALNGLVLGEAEAFHLGIPVQRTKMLTIAAAAVLVGCSVATVGLISFVGLVVPHVVRLAVAPDHRILLPAAALGGGILLVAADMAARTLVAPADLPISIVTALFGAPYFLRLLLRRDAALA